MIMLDEMIKAALELVNAIQYDNDKGGGLISTATIRASDELRVKLLAISQKTLWVDIVEED